MLLAAPLKAGCGKARKADSSGLKPLGMTKAMYYPAAATTFSAASFMVSATIKFNPDCCKISRPCSTFVPSSRSTIGSWICVLRAASTTPVASVSTRKIPPKMLISTALTFLSLRRISKACVTWSAFAPPPTSRKFAGIPPAQPAILTGDEWIDFHQRRIRLLKRSKQTSHKAHGFTDLLRLQPERERQLARLESFQTHAGIDVLFQNGSGILCRDLLNFHSARSGCHKHRPRFRSVNHDSEIEFLLNRQGFFDQQPANDAALRPGLVRNQLH